MLGARVRNGRWGVMVVSLTRGDTLYSVRAVCGEPDAADRRVVTRSERRLSDTFKAFASSSKAGGIVLILTAGATWGAWLLWQIGVAGRFTGASLHHVNAHGHAQIYGWVGLFIMGFAYQAFPRMWHVDLVAPRVRSLEGMILAWSPGTPNGRPVQGGRCRCVTSDR